MKIYTGQPLGMKSPISRPPWATKRGKLLEDVFDDYKRQICGEGITPTPDRRFYDLLGVSWEDLSPKAEILICNQLKEYCHKFHAPFHARLVFNREAKDLYDKLRAMDLVTVLCILSDDSGDWQRHYAKSVALRMQGKKA